MKDLISVIVPVFNGEKYLPKCLESIVNQSYRNLEIILVDDGSSDNSLDICYEYANRDERIKVFPQENRGPSAAMNRGLDLAQGEYIGFTDCDDYLDTNMFEILFNHLKEYDADISACDYLLVFEEDKENTEGKQKKENIKVCNGREAMETLYSEDLHVMNVVVWNKLYKNKVFDELRFDTGKWHEDEFIVHRILDKADKVVYSHLPLYYYLQRTSSFMGKQFNLTRLDYLEALEERMSYFKEKQFDRLYQKTLDIYINLLPKYYVLVSKFFPHEKGILEELKKKHRKTYKEKKDLPNKVKQKVKHTLFLISPFLYNIFRKILAVARGDTARINVLVMLLIPSVFI